MSVHGGGHGALEYYPCRYGGSRILFRGPRRQLDQKYIAFLGSTETYGRFIERPYPGLVEKRLSMACVNFGVVNAGVDLYLNDPSVLSLVVGAEAKVVQLMGAQNMSNRYYSVHPRRNDRFLKASERLENLYPEVDFTEFHFVRHMLGQLHDISAERFSEVVTELRQAWVARMKNILTQIRGKVVLLWFADHPVPIEGSIPTASDPLFVTRDMVETLRPRVTATVEVVPSEAALSAGTSGMVYSDFEACAAAEVMGPLAHLEVARALEDILAPLIGAEPEA
ncbi:DUF6473 family protein [Tropicibacter naphthalenivorans]|uniref:DUF6473 domain-containing protein n=1 Tax=Tropicibacter naphthalenivorans TaxID=441103 RepID=A0A0P1GC66_9RHOB|nr:DUF6473 family protein [Tropicibacter naphthalenivorans]CUH78965.1 hypothetical protein TRN7648_02259 [Tropicibacter naphthalenivorans]SMD04100.1 hypothetical protein SAMN04488093_111115 [Tropicibacter naphthalenivorans]